MRVAGSVKPASGQSSGQEHVATCSLVSYTVDVSSDPGATEWGALRTRMLPLLSGYEMACVQSATTTTTPPHVAEEPSRHLHTGEAQPLAGHVGPSMASVPDM